MKYNVVNVLDTELTCYENDVFPPGERKEIIQFGICMVDLAARKIIKTVSIPVIPTMSQVSPYCTALTGWTEAKLRKEGAVPFAEACRRLSQKYGARNRLLITDSDTETLKVKEQCELNAVEFPFGPGYLNISHLLAPLAGQRRRVGLEEMAALVGVEVQPEKLHRADYDATIIARIYLAVLEKASFKPKGAETIA